MVAVTSATSDSTTYSAAVYTRGFDRNDNGILRNGCWQFSVFRSQGSGIGSLAKTTQTPRPLFDWLASADNPARRTQIHTACMPLANRRQVPEFDESNRRYGKKDIWTRWVLGMFVVLILPSRLTIVAFRSAKVANINAAFAEQKATMENLLIGRSSIMPMLRRMIVTGLSECMPVRDSFRMTFLALFRKRGISL